MLARSDGVIDGRYRLGRELSRGGMGRVFSATHIHLGTSVAIKVLDSDDTQGSGRGPEIERERFLQEARAAAQLKHPNVVQVTDFGIFEEQPYLVMELLEGETLRARLERDRTLDPVTTASIIAGIARALTAAHAANIVHRDLKPDNVWIDERGTVKVLDFGIAKVASPTPSVTTASGAVLGTPAYMSPEQAQGNRDVDSASDRWALGVIAYECLVGQRPFDADALGELVLQICAWPQPVPSHHASVPDGFDAWFAQACAREREDRFTSATDQAEAFERMCRGEPTTPPKIATVRTLPKPRRPWLAVVAVLAIVLGVVIYALTRGGEPAVAATPPADVVRIAVLPRDDTMPGELAALSDMVTDELIGRLAGRSGVRVIARASVTSLRGKPRGELAGMAKTLGADQLLLARLERSGDRVKLAFELIAADQTVSWSQSYARPESELESVCALAILDLTVAIGAPRPAATAARKPAAFRAYRTGRDYWYRRDHESLTKAIHYFEEALRLEPDYASAWVGLVDAQLLLPWMGPTPRAEAYTRAKAALDRALSLAPETSEVQAARGNYLVEADWNFTEAERAYRKAIALDPDNANAHQWLAEVLGFSHRYDEALSELRLAEQLDPLISAVHKIRARTLYAAGRFAEAVAAADHTMARDPNQPWVSYGRGYALVKLGKFEEGIAAIKADPMMQVPGMTMILKAQELWVAAKRGDRAAVARLDAEIGTTLATDAPFVDAFVAAIVGDRKRMYAALARGVAAHDPWLPMTLTVFEFDPYRAEPEFVAFARAFAL